MPRTFWKCIRRIFLLLYHLGIYPAQFLRAISKTFIRHFHLTPRKKNEIIAAPFQSHAIDKDNNDNWLSKRLLCIWIMKSTQSNMVTKNCMTRKLIFKPKSVVLVRIQIKFSLPKCRRSIFVKLDISMITIYCRWEIAHQDELIF